MCYLQRKEDMMSKYLPLSLEEYLEKQKDEVEALKAMYPGDIEEDRTTGSPHPRFTVTLFPQRGSSTGGAGRGTSFDDHKTIVKLTVQFPPKYPKAIPRMTIKEYKGLSSLEIQDLLEELKRTAEEELGEVMMYSVLQRAEEYLLQHQKKPTGSFYDEMLRRNKQVEEKNLEMQMQFKEKERNAIKEEILRKQEEVKEELRRRREMWKSCHLPSPDYSQSASDTQNEVNSPTRSSESSTNSSYPNSLGNNVIKSMASYSRRKRRSISSRRKRSNSEGSDSSLSEASDLTVIEYLSGNSKTMQSVYKGEIIGKSESRGSTVYAGISKSGTLVAIHEWKFVVGTGGTVGVSDSESFLNLESLTKQLNSFETEFNLFTKLEHSNTIGYHGMKVISSGTSSGGGTGDSQEEQGGVNLYVIQEFVRGHTLKSYLKDPKHLCSMALPLLRHIFMGILEALRFLHDNNIAHRFLRDTSVFLDVGPVGDEVKVADFGIERKVCELYKLVKGVPEVAEHFGPSVGRGGKKADIYRVGMIMLSLLKGKYVDDEPDIPQGYPAELQDILKKCLSTLENSRWTAAELLEHPFVKMSMSKGPNIHYKKGNKGDRAEDDEEEDEEEEEGNMGGVKIDPKLASSLNSVPVSGQSRLHLEFLIQEWLGKGGFGDVLKVKNKLDGRIYALKRIKLNPRNKLLNKKITREVKLLSQLNHENVVRYFNSWIETVIEEENDSSTATEPMTTNTSGVTGHGRGNSMRSSPNKKKMGVVPPKEQSSVRFQLDFNRKNAKFNENSLGLLDNIEEMAPPVSDGDSEWSVSLANGNGANKNGKGECSSSSEEEEEEEEDEEEDSSDELDLFGTSFYRLTPSPTRSNPSGAGAVADEEDSEDAVIFESEETGTGGDTSSELIIKDERKTPNGKNQMDLQINGRKNGGDGENKKNVNGEESLNGLNGLANQSQQPRQAQYMYIQMEFCERSTLRQAIDDNLYEDVDRAWRLFREIVEGLVHIHQQGMIHRDLKPVNIFLDSGDHVKIGDFGLATSSILPKIQVRGPPMSEEMVFEQLVSHETNQQSVDIPEESQTGQVGTALYVAPELMVKANKLNYNQKVDIYSLGIIFFEMFHKPLPTGMERVRIISNLRLPSVTFPPDYDDYLTPQVTHITKWLLNHEPNQRPTSLGLLQSDYLPPPHLEEAELRDLFSRTLKNSQSKAYKFLIASCFLQNVSPVEDYTFDMENTRFNQNTFKSLHFVHRLKTTIQKVFEKHGGLEVGTPLLMPKPKIPSASCVTDLGAESHVRLMSHSGNLVALPHDLRTPFARYVGRYGIRHMKRYAIEKVFRERKIYGLHPRELVECAFDIVDCSPGSLITDAEVLSVALEVVGELPWMENKVCTIRMGHTKLIDGLLLHHGITSEKCQTVIKQTLAGVKLDSSTSKNQVQNFLAGKGFPEGFLGMLFALMEVEGSLAKVGNVFKTITKRKTEAASMIKAGLCEMELLMGHLEHLGVKCKVGVVPTLVFACHIYTGLIFQVVCSLRKRKNKVAVDVIAAGGRYDALIEGFRNTLSLEPDLSSLGSREQYNQCGVGISLSFDKLVAAYDAEDCQDWNQKGTVHAVICSTGPHPMAKEKLELMKELWAHGIKCTVFECSQNLEAAEEQVKDSGAQFMLILKEAEFMPQLRVKMWEKGLFQERKMSQKEAIDLIKSQIYHQQTSSNGNDLGSSNSNLGRALLNRNEQGSSGKMGGMGGSLLERGASGESDGRGGQGFMGMGNTSSVALLNISFVVQEKEKVANWKKRYENQVVHRITDVLPKLAKQQHVEVLGLDVNSSVVNNLASSLASHQDKEEFYKGINEVIEKHPRLRKYLQHISDEIYELWFEKNAAVIILYGLIDNCYRVLL